MLGKILASVGIGGASVDTVLDNGRVDLGGVVSGRVMIRGGSVAQDVTEIAAEIFTRVQVEVSDNEVWEDRRIADYELARGFRLHPGAREEMSFQIRLPLYTPVALGRERSPAWLRTRLDIPMAVDATDDDALVVNPAPVQMDTFRAMEALGFRLHKTDVEHRPHWQGGHGFVQEFEFKPATRGRSKFDEIELVFQPDHRGDGFELLIQVDRAARGFAGMLREMNGMDESWHRVYLPGGLRGPGQREVERALSNIIY